MTKTTPVSERLAANATRPDRTSHIQLSEGVDCQSCAMKSCLKICPAQTYTLSEDGSKVIVNFENCLECGACRLACPTAIAWKQPMGGFGIALRFG